MDEYKKYVADGEKIYPQKADSIKSYPGKNRIMLEWLIVDPKVDFCRIFWNQDGERKTVDIAVDNDDYEGDTVRAVIDGLEESSYIFDVISFDEFGNTSIPSEIEESAYGQIYETSLVNRVLKSKEYDDSGLTLEWYEAEATEVAVWLSYTDLTGKAKEVVVSRSSTETILPDFNVEHPFYYRTSYMPTPEAIDTFYAVTEEERVAYYADITDDFLQNTGEPFRLGRMVVDNRFYTAPGWNTNEAAAANGNIDVLKNTAGNHWGLTLWAWSGYSPAGSFTNGKLYQTIELDAGTYRFDALIYAVSPNLNRSYVVAALGEDLPDIADVSALALASAIVPADIQEAATNKPTLSVEFTLVEKATVSLGFVANIDHAQETIYKKVRLMERK
jgi:hypothetical protein